MSARFACTSVEHPEWALRPVLVPTEQESQQSIPNDCVPPKRRSNPKRDEPSDLVRLRPPRRHAEARAASRAVREDRGIKVRARVMRRARRRRSDPVAGVRVGLYRLRVVELAEGAGLDFGASGEALVVRAGTSVLLRAVRAADFDVA